MILDRFAAAVGGVFKDIQEAAIATGDFIVDEVSSVPAAFSAGYDHGLMSHSEPGESNEIIAEPEASVTSERVPFGTSA